MKLRHLFLGVSILLTSWVAFGAQSQTYPTAATTRIRDDTYNDSLSTIYNATFTVVDSTWTEFGSTWVWVNPGQYITGYYETWVGSTPTVVQSSWTLNDYNANLLFQNKNDVINSIVNQDMEVYMVWPDTTNFPVPGTWKGWCLSYVNGNPVPIICPTK